MDKNVTINEAQSDMCKGYANGSVGVIVSGFMWLLSAFVSHHFSANQAIWVLLIGGAMINPISNVIEKVIGLNGYKAGNPFKNLAMESTVWMILGAILGVAAYLLFYFKLPSFYTLLTGSLIEISFGLFLYIYFRRHNPKESKIILYD